MIIPLLSAGWLLTVKPANAQYPGGGYPGGNNSGLNDGGTNSGLNNGVTDAPGNGPGGTSSTGGSGSGYPGSTGGTNTGYPGSNTGTNSGYPGSSTGGAGTGYPGGGTDGSNTGGTGTGGTDGTITPGHWDVTYSNQNATTSWHYLRADNTVQSGHYDWPAASSGDTLPSNTYLDAKTTGQVTAHLKWVPTTGQDAASDPPSDSVIVTESGSAGEMGGGSGKGTADDGWGDSSAPAWPRGGTSDNSAYSSGTHYEVKDGSSGDITVGPFTLSADTPANVTPDPSGYFSQVGATLVTNLNVVGDSVTINPGGATLVNKAYKALTGQQISATLNLPPGYTAIGNQSNWTITGGDNVFHTYNEKAASHQLVLLSDSAAYTTGAAFKFYDKAAEIVTINCTTTLLAPDGTLTPGVKIQPSQPISFVKPTVAKWLIDTGYVQPLQGLWALLSDPAKNYPGGENWRDITISVPQPFVGGQGCIAQLIKPDLEVLQDTAPFTRQDANNKKQGLDNAFPYPDSLWDLPALGKQSDRPVLGALGLNANGYEGFNTTFRTDNFDTWVMYKPIGATSVWVPLQKYSWSWSCTLKWQNDQWTKTAAFPADATQDPHYTAIGEAKDPPTWDRVWKNEAH